MNQIKFDSKIEVRKEVYPQLDFAKPRHHFREQIRVLQRHPEIFSRFTDLRKRVFPIFPSQYDITNICNLNCVGCLYFDGDDVFDGQPELDAERLDRFFETEASRGVNFAHISGAEPSLNPAAMRAASRHIPRGVIYTNGHRKIDADIDFRLHISIWALGDREALLRGQGVLARALENYADDPRAVFVLTLSKESVKDLDEVAEICFLHGVTLTLNQYSPTVRSETPNPHLRKSQKSGGADNLDLVLEGDALSEAFDKVFDLQARYPETIRFSRAYAAQMAKPGGLFQVDPSTGISSNCASRLNDKMRHYLPDLQAHRGNKCCTSHIDCASCGLYAMAYATMINELGNVPAELPELEAWIEVAELWEALFCLPTSGVALERR
ncbi:MAG: radical SAM protein [Alphaproteobacteria bacterium]